MIKEDVDKYLRRGRNIFLQQQYQEIAILAKKNNIKLVALKGIAYLYDLYQDPAQRDISDIDILVHYSSVNELVELLSTIGYKVDFNRFNPQKPYSDYLNSIVLRKETNVSYFVHLHWNLKNTSLPLSMFKFDMEKIFNEAKLFNTQNSSFFLLKPEHNFLYMTFHAFVHSYDRESLLEDMHIFYNSNQDSIETKELLVCAKEWGLEVPLYCATKLLEKEKLDTMLSCLRKNLGTKLIQRCDSFCDQIRKTGGSQNLAMPLYLAIEKNYLKRMVFMWRTMFPSFSTMERIYSKKSSKEIFAYYLKRLQNSLIQLRVILLRKIYCDEFKFFAPLLVKYKKQIYMMLFFLFLAIVSAVAIPLAVKSTVDNLFADMKSSGLIYSAIAASLFYLISMVFQTMANYLRRMVRVGLRNDISIRQFDNYLKMDFKDAFLDGAGAKAYELIQDCERASDALVSLIADGFFLLPKFIFIVLMLCYFDILSVVFVFVTLLILTYVGKLLSKKMKSSYEEILNKEQSLSKYLHDIFENMFLIKAFGSEEHEQKRYMLATQEFAQVSKKNIYLETAHSFFSSSSSRLTLVLLLFLSLYRIQVGNLSAGTFSAALVYLMQLALMQNAFIMMQHRFEIGRLACSRLSELCSPANSGQIIVNRIATSNTEKIITENISFSYGVKKVFDDFSCQISSGWTSIVGPSGSGKSTLLNLILGLLQPDGGSISLHQKPKTQNQEPSVSTRIVTQEALLWNDTVLNNIAYGSQGISFEDILAAAKLADVDSFIKDLEFKYSTIIAPEASNLSEGQKQKICLARALVSKPEILLIDEAFSSLDEESEAKIIKNLKQQTWLKYVIVVSHRKSTILQCDKSITL